MAEIRTDASDHHEEPSVLPISVCMKQHRESVIIVVSVVVLNCCKVSTCSLTTSIVGRAVNACKQCKVFQLTTVKFLVVIFGLFSWLDCWLVGWLVGWLVFD